MNIFQDVLLSRDKKNETKIRKGINAANPMSHFTIKSATARDTHSGVSAPKVRKGTISHDHEISLFAASEKNAICAEKAIVKKTAVTIKDASSVEARGAYHHSAERNLLNTAISNSCAIIKARPDAIATLNATAGYS